MSKLCNLWIILWSVRSWTRVVRGVAPHQLPHCNNFTVFHCSLTLDDAETLAASHGNTVMFGFWRIDYLWCPAPGICFLPLASLLEYHDVFPLTRFQLCCIPASASYKVNNWLRTYKRDLASCVSIDFRRSEGIDNLREEKEKAHFYQLRCLSTTDSEWNRKNSENVAKDISSLNESVELLSRNVNESHANNTYDWCTWCNGEPGHLYQFLPVYYERRSF